MHNIQDLFRRDYTRNFFKLFSSLMLAQGLSVALAPLLSRLYTPEDFGLVAIYMAISGLLSMVATGKYEQAIMLPKRNEDAASLVMLVLMITLVVSLVVFFVVVLFNKPIIGLLQTPELSIWLYFIPLIMILHGIYQSLTYYANRMKYFGIMASGTLIQHVVLNLTRIALGIERILPNGLILSQIVSPVFSAIYMIRKITPRMREYFEGVNFQNIRYQGSIYSQYPRFNLIQSLTNNLAASLPIFMFTSGFSAQIAGLYSFGFTFVFRPMSLFSQSTLQVLSQKVIEDHNNGKDIYPGLKKLVWSFFRLGIIPFILLGIFAPWIFSIVFSPVWTEAGTMIQILLPWLFMVYLTSPLSFVPELFFQQKKSMIIDFISLILRFAALYTGIHFNNVYLSLILYTLVSFTVVAYCLLWYLRMARNNSNRQNHTSNKELWNI
jgi:O-antigen/teichoic acid export membrane protein